MSDKTRLLFGIGLGLGTAGAAALYHLWSSLRQAKEQYAALESEFQKQKAENVNIRKQLETTSNLSASNGESNATTFDSPILEILHSLTATIQSLSGSSKVDGTDGKEAAGNDPKAVMLLRSDLVNLLKWLASTKLYEPDLDSLLRVNVDNETKEWLIQEYSHLKESVPLADDRRDLTSSQMTRSSSGKTMEIDRWDFNLWDHREETLKSAIIDMFDEFELLDIFHIERKTMVAFLDKVKKCYNDNPYHNFRHAFDVTQSLYLFISKTQVVQSLSCLEIFALLVAAVCHDLEHPGTNNTYQVNTQTSLALLYNDQSVLENHHASKSFQITNSPDCNIFSGLTPAQFKKVRRIIIQAILHTDMANHSHLTALFSLRADSYENWTAAFGSSSEEDQIILMSMLLHASDLSNAVKTFKISKIWSDRVLEEFFQQGDLEKKKGLPASPMCDRGRVSQAKMSINFIDLIIYPLYKPLHKLLPEIQELMTNLTVNRQTWEKLALEEHTLEQQKTP